MTARTGPHSRRVVAWYTGASASVKTEFVLELVAALVGGGHRVLLFSQSRLMLDVLGGGLATRRLAFLRIDGSVTSAEERQARLLRCACRIIKYRNVS